MTLPDSRVKHDETKFYYDGVMTVFGGCYGGPEVPASTIKDTRLGEVDVRAGWVAGESNLVQDNRVVIVMSREYEEVVMKALIDAGAKPENGDIPWSVLREHIDEAKAEWERHNRN